MTGRTRSGTRRVACTVLNAELRLTLQELSDLTGLKSASLVEMVDEGLIEPLGRRPGEWTFAGHALPRVQAALRLQRDLGVNLAGAILVLDLLDEVQQLRRRVDRLQFHIHSE